MITVKVDNSAHVSSHLSATTDADLISSPLPTSASSKLIWK